MQPSPYVPSKAVVGLANGLLVAQTFTNELRMGDGDEMRTKVGWKEEERGATPRTRTPLTLGGKAAAVAKDLKSASGE